MSHDAVTEYAHAKVNLTLEILGKRPDGYHEIVSLMQALALHDTLTFAPAGDLTLRCNVSELAVQGNLVLRAARLLQTELGVSKGAAITLEKSIPIAAGLGGGSSDCAAALRALNRLWSLGLSLEQLTDFGAKLGSDVPFFFHGGTALVEGRGEKVTPLPSFPFYWVALVTPRVLIADKTTTLYGKITPSEYASGKATRLIAELLLRGETVDASLLSNAFLPVLLRENDAVRACWDRMQLARARQVLLSGSGPTLYSLLDNEEEARSIPALLMGLDAEVLVTTTTSLEEIPGILPDS